MLPTSLCLLAGFATSSVLAFPTASPAVVPTPARCEDYGECVEIDYFGYRVTRLVNATGSGLNRRDDNIKTIVEVGQNQIRYATHAFDENYPGDAPFTELWDRILEGCLSTTCDDQRPIDADGYRLTVTGQFPPADGRDNFVDLLKEAFFRAQTVKESSEVITIPGGPNGLPLGQRTKNEKITQGLDILNANRYGGEDSGTFMTVRISQIPLEGGCGEATKAINAAGALAFNPVLASFFGLVSVACSE